VPGGPDAVRRDEVVLERESVLLLSEKKRRVVEARLGGAKFTAGGLRGGDKGPRRSLRRCRAASHSVHGCVCDSPMWPQPLCCVKFWKHIADVCRP